MLGLVQAGLGAAIVPEAATGLHPDGIDFRPLDTRPERPVELHMVWRRVRIVPALEAMLELCGSGEE